MYRESQLKETFIETFIPSKDTRAFLQKTGHRFSDREKAVIIANHFALSKEEKISCLQILKEDSTDEKLRADIEEECISIAKKEDWDHFSSGPLFDYVFIPHDFRHGDIVSIPYTTFGSGSPEDTVGVILDYFDEDYEFKKQIRGDYSDMQVTVDTKYYGREYQGEFAHEHVNPIYIERRKLPADDSRLAYLNYLIEHYKTMRYPFNTSGSSEAAQEKVIPERIPAIIETVQKAWQKHPELSLRELVMNGMPISGLSPADDRLMDDLYNIRLKEEESFNCSEELRWRHQDASEPVYDEEYRCWCVKTAQGFAEGSASYVAAEFCRDNVIYPYDINGEHQHSHSFDGVIEAILNDHKGFSIAKYPDAYSDQERRVISNLLKAYNNQL